MTSLFSISIYGKGLFLNVGGKTFSKYHYNELYFIHNEILLHTTAQKIKSLGKMKFKGNSAPFHHINKKGFANYFTSRVMIYQSLRKLKISMKSFSSLLRFNIMKQRVTYYLQKRFLPTIKLSDEELDAYYQKNKNHFNGIAVTDEVIEIIRQRIISEKFNKKVQEFVKENSLKYKKKKDWYFKVLTEKKYSKKTIYPGGFWLNQKEFLKMYYSAVSVQTGLSKKQILEKTKGTKDTSIHIKKFGDNLLNLCLLYKRSQKNLSYREKKNISEITTYDIAYSWVINKKVLSRVTISNREILSIYKKLYPNDLPLKKKKRAFVMIAQRLHMLKVNQEIQKFLIKLKKGTVIKGKLLSSFSK